MKKNILTIIIMAMTAINVIMTAILFFVMMPTFNKVNDLISRVATIMDLEMESEEDGDGAESYSVSDLETYEVAFDDQETVNLKDSGDGEDHYAMLGGFSLSINKKSKDYKKLSKTLDTQKSQIKAIVLETIGQHTAEDISREAVMEESLKKIQELFDSKFIVSVSSLDGFVFQ